MNPTTRLAALPRRDFLRLGATALAAAGAPWPTRSPRATAQEPSLQGRIYKSLKIGMVKLPGTLPEKFAALAQLGFDGVEMDSPGMDVDATRAAVAATRFPVDGTVCSTHWSVRHSDPDPAVRARALDDLQTAISDTHAVGGHSVLLVPGHGKDGTEQEVWDRSIANIRGALPLAAHLGVRIAFENVWNQFLYDHGGGADQTADKLRDYVDAFDSPWIGVHFDIGNHQKYGKPAAWIRTLGRRIVKLDVKDWGVEAGWAAIGEGDVDWADVRAALSEIGYTGWAAAEVAGGDRDHLLQVSRRMDRVLALDRGDARK